jgi:hypothetical protein
MRSGEAEPLDVFDGTSPGIPECTGLAPAGGMRRIPSLIAVLLVPVAACGGGSTPSSPSSPGASGMLQGQTVSAIDGSASPNLSVRIGVKPAVTSDGNGFFEVDLGGQGSYRTRIRGTNVVERDMLLDGPGRGRRQLSVIPSNFDLEAFNEMFRSRNSRLQRWTTRPALVVLGSVMRYRSNADNEYEATSEQLSDDEVSEMVAHLSEGLELLTGSTYTTFTTVEVERPPAGQRVDVARNHRIVVGRYTGIVSLANTIGYGQWLENSDGTIVGGAIFLDRDFDRSDTKRRLLRIHELGHALGYQHVRSRTSIMNPTIGPEPTDFDRAGATIAFQRPPGNQTPDTDPNLPSMFGVVTEGRARWAPPVYCR